MNDKKMEADPYLINLVISFSQAAIVGMGKISNPMTGKIEKNMDIAKVNIEMLAMLKEKTKGNITKEEADMISDTLASLQLTYADEKSKPHVEEKKSAAEDEKKEKPKIAEKDAEAEEKE